AGGDHRRCGEVTHGPPPVKQRAPRLAPGRPVMLNCGPPVEIRFSAAEEAFRAEARAWLQAHVLRHPRPPRPGARAWTGAKGPRAPRPGGADLRARRAYDMAWQRRMYDAGWAGISWPVADGGGGGGPGGGRVLAEGCAR